MNRIQDIAERMPRDLSTRAAFSNGVSPRKAVEPQMRYFAVTVRNIAFLK